MRPEAQFHAPFAIRRKKMSFNYPIKIRKQIWFTILASLLFPLILSGCLALGCSWLVSLPSFFAELPDTVRANPNRSKMDVYAEFGVTGVISPAQTSGAGLVARLELDGEMLDLPPLFDELDYVAEHGFIAIRVPHAPPTYTTSTVTDPSVKFSYYTPPESTIATTESITVVKRSEYLAQVMADYPISDGHSHWEVWWLPEGEPAPVPTTTFRLDATSYPAPFAFQGMIDFGSSSLAKDCAGCVAEMLFYNGYGYIGPFETTIVLSDYSQPDPFDIPGNPTLDFGVHCGTSTVWQEIQATKPFTQVHWLENYDTVTHTVSISADSWQGWEYTFYTSADGNMPALAGSAPFQVDIGPRPLTVFPPNGCLQILAVASPTLTDSDIRETLSLTANSQTEPSATASTRKRFSIMSTISTI